MKAIKKKVNISTFILTLQPSITVCTLFFLKDSSVYWKQLLRGILKEKVCTCRRKYQIPIKGTPVFVKLQLYVSDFLKNQILL